MTRPITNYLPFFKSTYITPTYFIFFLLLKQFCCLTSPLLLRTKSWNNWSFVFGAPVDIAIDSGTLIKMDHFTPAGQKQLSPMSCNGSHVFTITQWALGRPLQFTPPVGTAELDDLINRYVPGNKSISQKRGIVSYDFFNSITPSTQHPVTLSYNVPLPTTLNTQLSTPVANQKASPSQESPRSASAVSPNTSKSSASRKRSLQDSTSTASASSAKRLPGFSIMTKDGVDITDYASRGPKTKEQREHAALMRKLKACGPCKRSKQRVRFRFPILVES
jgi:hypothetical protein